MIGDPNGQVGRDGIFNASRGSSLEEMGSQNDELRCFIRGFENKNI